MKNNAIDSCIVGYNPGRVTPTWIVPIWIVYHPANQKVSICTEAGIGPGAHGATYSPETILTYRPYVTTRVVVDGVLRILKSEQAPPGWFERTCRECNCEWFFPLVKRMASGEQVQLQEVQDAYLAHNGKPLPSGTWHELFREFL